MTRHQRFDVRVAPQVVRAISERAHHSHEAADDARQVHAALDRLGRSGTRAEGAKKLRSLDLWEIRAGRYRLFLCLVPGTRVITVGALIVKSSRRIRMARLKQIERRVHRWRDRLERDR